MRRKLLHLIVFITFITGCAAAGVQVTEDKLTTLKKDESTIDEVVAMLGKPTNSTLNSDGTRIIVYSYAKVSTRAESFIPIVGLFAGGGDMHTNVVTMTFDSNGKLKDYSSSCGELGVGTGIISSNTTFDRVGNQPREQNTINTSRSEYASNVKSTSNVTNNGTELLETKDINDVSMKENTPPNLITPIISQTTSEEVPKIMEEGIDASLKNAATEFSNKLERYNGQVQSLYIENGSTLIAEWSSQRCYFFVTIQRV